MSRTSAHSLSQKGALSTKLVMGLLVAAVSMFVGTAGVANATNHGPANVPSSKEDCKGGWATRTDENGNPFKNQGQCVKWVNGQSHGYGGGGNVGGDISVSIGDIVGDNNTINIIVNYFLGATA